MTRSSCDPPISTREAAKRLADAISQHVQGSGGLVAQRGVPSLLTGGGGFTRMGGEKVSGRELLPEPAVIRFRHAAFLELAKEAAQQECLVRGGVLLDRKRDLERSAFGAADGRAEAFAQPTGAGEYVDDWDRCRTMHA
jgi:hypothetical protein